ENRPAGTAHGLYGRDDPLLRAGEPAACPVAQRWQLSHLYRATCRASDLYPQLPGAGHDSGRDPRTAAHQGRKWPGLRRYRYPAGRAYRPRETAHRGAFGPAGTAAIAARQLWPAPARTGMRHPARPGRPAAGGREPCRQSWRASPWRAWPGVRLATRFDLLSTSSNP